MLILANDRFKALETPSMRDIRDDKKMGVGVGTLVCTCDRCTNGDVPLDMIYHLSDEIWNVDGA